MDWVSGKKTYILGITVIIYGLGLCWQGQTADGMQKIWEGLTACALRAGVTKSGPTF